MADTLVEVESHQLLIIKNNYRAFKHIHIPCNRDPIGRRIGARVGQAFVAGNLICLIFPIVILQPKSEGNDISVCLVLADYINII